MSIWILSRYFDIFYVIIPRFLADLPVLRGSTADGLLAAPSRQQLLLVFLWVCGSAQPRVVMGPIGTHDQVQAAGNFGVRPPAPVVCVGSPVLKGRGMASNLAMLFSLHHCDALRDVPDSTTLRTTAGFYSTSR